MLGHVTTKAQKDLLKSARKCLIILNAVFLLCLRSKQKHFQQIFKALSILIFELALAKSISKKLNI